MKFLSFFLASSLAQDEEASDRGYVSYDYGFSNYGGYGSSNYDIGKFTFNNAATLPAAGDSNPGNGLYCWTCHGRLRLNEAETNGDNNAWYDCATNGGAKMCKGEERVCLTEERRRNEVTTEVITMCKSPEACVYLWKRNEKFMPLFHHYGDQVEDDNPDFFDDECRFRRGAGTNDDNNKFKNHRAQWEGSCRHCCKADDTNGAGACNGPASSATSSPLGSACASSAGCATVNGGAYATFGTSDFNYSIKGIPTFLVAPLTHDRAHPGFGRNSAPADKFSQKKNQGTDLLEEQADMLSQEDIDFHNKRPTLTKTFGDTHFGEG